MSLGLTGSARDKKIFLLLVPVLVGLFFFPNTLKIGRMHEERMTRSFWKQNGKLTSKNNSKGCVKKNESKM